MFTGRFYIMSSVSWVSVWGIRPSMLIWGTEHRLIVYILIHVTEEQVYSECWWSRCEQVWGRQQQTAADSSYWLQGSATRAVNSRALMVDSLMSSRNGRSARNTSRFKLMERPMATTAVAAAASLPSSFTCTTQDSCIRTERHILPVHSGYFRGFSVQIPGVFLHYKW